ncbi:putative HPr kinase/phosphorylase [Pillotina sp. SPG140]|jgi:HPr kinase/phosphorylase
MDESFFTVLDLIDLDLKEYNALNLRCIGGRKGLYREICIADVNRPGLILAGFYEHFAYERIQLFGKGETAYLDKLAADGAIATVNYLFSYPIPCCIFTHSLVPTKIFLEQAEHAQCPILQTDLTTTTFHSRLMHILTNIFSPRQKVHGVLVEVYGLGVLLMGSSGIGKSETALELIKRGHRLVADDSVKIHCINGTVLVGTGAAKIGHHMEIRGVGIINVTHLFGIGAIRDRKEIQLVVVLDEWDNKKNYDRFGDEENCMEFLGIKVPMVEVPVKEGRFLPVIVETAAMNERLKRMGYNAGKEFNQNIMKWLESGAKQSVYFGSDDII